MVNQCEVSNCPFNKPSTLKHRGSLPTSFPVPSCFVGDKLPPLLKYAKLLLGLLFYPTCTHASGLSLDRCVIDMGNRDFPCCSSIRGTTNFLQERLSFWWLWEPRHHVAQARLQFSACLPNHPKPTHTPIMAVACWSGERVSLEIRRMSAWCP